MTGLGKLTAITQNTYLDLGDEKKGNEKKKSERYKGSPFVYGHAGALNSRSSKQKSGVKVRRGGSIGGLCVKVGTYTAG